MTTGYVDSEINLSDVEMQKQEGYKMQQSSLPRNRMEKIKNVSSKRFHVRDCQFPIKSLENCLQFKS